MPIVTVFGGTGFLGRRVVDRLLAHGISVRIASRRPGRLRRTSPEGEAQATPVAADVHDDRSVAAALEGVDGAVNAVSLYVEKGTETFRSVHVEAARRVAKLAREGGLVRLVHLSGIGSDSRSPSPYIRSRGEGEQAVCAEFPDATLVRPAVMIGPEDAFLTPLVDMLSSFPAFPLFGRGETRLQPAYVGDVAEAIARCLERAGTEDCYEFGGPEVYSYRSLVEAIRRQIDGGAWLLPMPFCVWHPLARVAEILPNPPITRNQVELMRVDNVPAADAPGFRELEIDPTAVDKVLGRILRDRERNDGR